VDELGIFFFKESFKNPIRFIKSLPNKEIINRSENLSKKNISFILVPIISSQTLRFFGANRFLCLFSFLILLHSFAVSVRITERKAKNIFSFRENIFWFIFSEGKYKPVCKTLKVLQTINYIFIFLSEIIKIYNLIFFNFYLKI
jgi:hypothetical protein